MSQAKPDYRPDIDGLRAIAVMAVVIHHLSAPLLPGGYVGVDVFFVISGYLITRIISREIEDGSFTFAQFYERRARRIFPALFAVLAVTLVAGYFLLLPSDYAGTLRGTLGTLFFASNVVFWRDMAAGYFAATDAGLNPLLHTWSLAVEEQFYVFFPVLLLLCYRYFRRHIILVLVACALVSLAGAALLVQSKSVAVFFLSPFRAWELLVGSLLAVNAIPAVRSRLVRELIAGTGLLAILVPCILYDGKTAFPGLTALAPVLGATAIMHVGSSGPSWTGRLLQWRPLLYIGLISYSLYLWHWPLIVIVRYAMGMAPITPYIALLLLASLALASLSYHFIEQPVRRRPVLTRRFIVTSSAVCASVLALISGIGLMHGGYAARFAPEVVQLDLARSPQIPFVECDGKPIADACQLGRTDRTATMLLWGDSHMLAWAPALQSSLARLDTRAVFVPTSSCPPMLDVENTDKGVCQVQNLTIKAYLLTNPNIKTVLMSAYWSTYFKSNGTLTTNAGNPTATRTSAAQNALASTIRWLRDNGRHVVLIGPVPVSDQSVPLALALEAAKNWTFPRTSMDEQHKKNISFFKVVESTSSSKDARGDFRFLDPIQWLCSDECMIMKHGVPLYRDSNHLSVAGAMALEPRLSVALALSAQTEPRRSSGTRQ